nr:hypothetical protein [Tanacetum cinerariifolium]
DERTESKKQETNNGKEESDDDFVHTPLNYVPTNDDSNNVDEEECFRIDKELYGNVNDSLTDAKQDDRDEEDADMTDVAHVQNAITEVPPFSSSHSISSIYTSAFLNLENLQYTKTEVVSMLDINVQHKVLRTSKFLTILFSVIPKHIVFNPSETVTTSLTKTIISLLSSLFPTLPQSAPIPTPTNTKATISTTTILESETPNAIHLRLSYLEKEVTWLKNVDHSSELLSTIKSKVPNAFKEYLRTSLDDAYHKDDDAMDEGIAEKLKKRKPDDADQDKGPTVGSGRGLKRQRTSKGTKTSKNTSILKDSFKGKSPSTFSKSSKFGKSIKDQVEEPIFVQDFDYANHDDVEFDNTDMPIDQGEDLGKTNEQPNDEDVPNIDWYKKSRSDTSPNPEWNEGKLVDDGPKQSWLNDMTKATKPPLTFYELMHAPIDFSAFVMNHLKINNLTKEHLVGLVYNMLKETCKIYVELDYTMEECYHALFEQLDWNNPEGHHCPYDLTKPLPMQMSSQECFRIDKELYGNVNDSLTDAKQDDRDEEDADMTDVAHVQNAITEVPPFSSSHSISSIYTSAFLNLENLQYTKTEVVSMLDINVQHKVLRTSKFLTILFSVIPKHIVFNPSETVTTSLTKTIISLLSSLFPTLPQSAPIPTPTNTKATISTTTILESETPNAIHLRLSYLEKEVTWLKNVDHSSELLSTIKSKVPNAFKEYLRTSLDDAYHKDDDAMDEGIAEKLKKRKPDDADQDKGPTVGSGRGLKRQRTSKGTKTSKNTSILKDSFKGKSPSTFSKSSKFGKSIKDQVEEPIFVQDFDYANHDDVEFDNTDMPIDQGEDLGKTNEQPNDEDVPNIDWYKKSRSDTSPNPEWNEGKLVDDGPKQSWLNDMTKATKPPLTFYELMHAPIDFSAFVMNHLKINNLTKEHLVGLVYNMLKETCKIYVELDYTMEECYHALFEQLDWNNPEGHHCPYDLTKPLPMQMSSQAFTTKSKAIRYELKGIEDMVPNLWSPVRRGVSAWETGTGLVSDYNHFKIL